MQKRKISDFFLSELTDYSCYSTLRMLGSAIDGLKNSQRKIIHTALDKLKSSTKVSVFDNQMQSYTQYLHGSASGVVSNMGASYTGSNALPLLKGEGNFGSRMVNDAAAPRYIYVSNQPYIHDVFDIRDVLIPQSFEGSQIEPLFFVPSVPVLVVNGSMNCLASGFKQHILPRNLNEILKFYQGKKCNLNPWIKGFEGTVQCDKENPNKFYLCGNIKIIKNKVQITEIPPFIEYAKYLEILDELLEKKKIKSYKDSSNVKTQKFSFEVTLNKVLNENQALELLKLKRTENEIYNALDENNQVRTFKDIKEILEYFKSVRLKFLEKQRLFDIEKTKLELLKNASKYKFVQMIMANELIIFKRKKAEVVLDLQKTNLYKDTEGEPYNYLLSMQIHSFTEETLKILQSKIENLQSQLKSLEEKDIQVEFIQKIQNLNGEIK